MQAVSDICVVEKMDDECMSPTGLYLPRDEDDESRMDPETGRVTDVGEGGVSKWGHHVPMNVKVGDLILFKRHCGTKLRIVDLDPSSESYKSDKVYRCVAPWERLAILEEISEIDERAAAIDEFLVSKALEGIARG